MQNIIRNLTKAKPEPLVKFLYVILDKLITLMILKPPRNCQIGKEYISAGQVCFEMLAQLVKIITLLVDTCCDIHGRSGLLTAFIRYSRLFSRNFDSVSRGYNSSKVNSMCEIRSGQPADGSTHASRSPSHVDLIDIIRGFEQASSFRVPPEVDTFQGTLPANSKLLHEEIVIQWIVSTGSAREMAFTNSWFFLELLSKSMAEYLAVSRRLYLPRKMRFSNQLTDDIITLVTAIISETVVRCSKDFRIAQNINCSLAFFVRDMFSLMNRTYVFQLIRLYCRDVMNKVVHGAEAAQLLSLKLDFLRIIASHEHFVTLNLPMASPPFPVSSSLAVDVAVARALPGMQPPSPSSSSVSSRSSAGSAALSTTTTGSSVGAAELTAEFRALHFLCGLLLTDVALILETNSSYLHSKAVNIVRNVFSCHDADPRLSTKPIKAKIAALYFPFLGIVLDSVVQLYDPYCGRPKNDYAFPADSKPMFTYTNESSFSRNTAMV
ncbi:unnamed protein product [Soboliphyme baturini]|uniref:DUF1741 domain-containing protein n=1 Tax=Soboliphyme baturini TaxID=241478 RepID=A0A183J9A1_9BILA|nr:unnamed protein product [Soboliphyme baturini]